MMNKSKKVIFSAQMLKPGNVIRGILAVAVTIVMIFPLYWMLATALKTEAEVMSSTITFWPAVAQFENFSYVVNKVPFFRYMLNTAVITGKNFEARLMEVLRSNGIQMIVLAGFMKILSGGFTSQWPDRILNIHPALIPSFCGEGYYGLRVHEEALRYGVKVTGATVHFVNEIPDGGKIIAQKAVEIEEGDTPEILQRRVMEQAEWILLPQATETVARMYCTE